MVLHQGHLGDEVGGLDQLGLGVPPGDDDVQVRAAALFSVSTTSSSGR